MNPEEEKAQISMTNSFVPEQIFLKNVFLECKMYLFSFRIDVKVKSIILCHVTNQSVAISCLSSFIPFFPLGKFTWRDELFV